MKGITSVLSACALLFFTTTAFAQDDTCGDFFGAAFGLCNAYCEAMDCDGDEPNANEKACGKVFERFMNQTGEVPPCEVEYACPCFTSEDLQGEVAQCGENFPGFDNMAGMIFEDGNQACSGENCNSGSGQLSCAISANAQGQTVFADPITAEEDDACRTLIMANCDSPNAPTAAAQASSSDGSVIPFIER